MFLLAPDWSKYDYPQLKLGNIREYTKRQKVSFPLSQTYTSSGMKVFVLFHFIQDERTFFGCSGRRNMFVHKILLEKLLEK